LYTSTNLNTWTKVTDLETGASGGQLITGDLAFGDKAVGDATDLMVIAPNSDTGVVRLWHTAGTGANPSMTDVTPAGEAGDTVCIATDGSGRFMVGLDNGTIQYSDNAGSTWSGAIDVVAANTQNIANLYYNTANSRWIAGVENEGIYESTDGGDTWSKVNDWAASTDVHYPVFWEV
jgi:hypothetical protein